MPFPTDPNNQPYLDVKRLPDADGVKRAIIPTRNNPTDAGLDLYSNQEVTLVPGQRAVVKTGIAVQFPAGYGLFVWDRSGLSTKFGLTSLAGVIDSAFRGEVGVALINLGQEPYTIKKGDRIAQGILAPIALPTIREVDELADTSRGQKGFGSSGV